VNTDTFAFRFVMNVVLGAVSGGLTSDAAVRLMFAPRKPFLGLQGAIPKNKARLARSIGRTVGQRLLTPADIAAELQREGLQQRFETMIADVVSRLLETERGTLREMLPPKLFAEVSGALDHLAVLALERARKWGDVAASDPATAAGLRKAVVAGTDALLESTQPMAEQLPPGLKAALEQAVEDWLPALVAKLARLLHEPEARERVRTALDAVVRRFIGELQFHERVVAKLLVTEKTLDKALDALGEDGAEQVAQALDDPAIRSELMRILRESAEKTLRRPPSALLGAPGSTRATALQETLGDLAVRALGSPAAREAVFVPAEDALRDAVTTLLDRPIGKPSRWLPPEASQRIAAALAPALWDWLMEQIPAIVEQIDLEEMIERKVNGFSLDQIEKLVRDVTQRELNLIVLLGYALGGAIGLVLLGIEEIIRRI
jgi:uncharacterized membrane protein YheB (UPF0754 family)